MRIEQLQYLATVARLGSFRRAADALHISQPALSSSVRSLERELGVDMLERGRHGARVSGSGRDLLPYILTVLDAHVRLQEAASGQRQITRHVRLGVASTAVTPLLTLAIRQFREARPAAQVEVTGGPEAEIQRGLFDGRLDLGLVTYLDGDDLPAGLETAPLLCAPPVVCLRPDNGLAAVTAVPVAALRDQPLIAMRAGDLMHRYRHRLLPGEEPGISFSADGAEMAKLMVAEGLGITVLPGFSVAGDLLERRGIITSRPLAGDETKVHLDLQRTRAGSLSEAAAALHEIFVARAREMSG